MKGPSGRSRRLIVNADGYGLSPGVNRGIEEVCAAGFVRSVSANANGVAIGDLAGFVRRFPDVGIGVHFNLTVGRPLLPPERVPSLVNESGGFWGRDFTSRAYRGRLRVEEMEAELWAQVERVRDLGATLDHWDSHQGMHVHPPFLQAATRVARRAGIRAVRTHDYWLPVTSAGPLVGFFLRRPMRLASFAARRAVMVLLRARGFWMADRAVLLGLLPGTDPGDPATWRRLLRVLPPGTSEVWCHPGYADDELRRVATLVESREGEVVALRDPSLAEAAREAGVALARFQDLVGGNP